jgi:hypothetical protein
LARKVNFTVINTTDSKIASAIGMDTSIGRFVKIHPLKQKPDCKGKFHGCIVDREQSIGISCHIGMGKTTLDWSTPRF